MRVGPGQEIITDTSASSGLQQFYVAKGRVERVSGVFKIGLAEIPVAPVWMLGSPNTTATWSCATTEVGASVSKISAVNNFY